MKKSNWLWITAVFSTLLFLSIMLLPAATALAELPPRPEPVTVSDVETIIVGAEIQLVVPEEYAGAYTVVQWQDGLGDWHDVEGWRGELDNNGLTKTWWLASEHFGTGPFRWQVFTEIDGDLLATTADFTMPEQARQRLILTP